MEVKKTTQAEAVRNFYRRQGAEAERQRIIELLNAEISEFMWTNVGTPIAAFGYANTLGFAIKLIKETIKE